VLVVGVLGKGVGLAVAGVVPVKGGGPAGGDGGAQRNQVTGACAGPAVQDAPPRCGDGGGPVGGAEQAAGDRGHGVGVAAAAHRRLQRQLQVLGAETTMGGVIGRHRGVGDRRPRRLQRLHHPPVAVERCRFVGFGVVEAPGPHHPPGLGEVGQTDARVEVAGEYGVADGQ